MADEDSVLHEITLRGKCLPGVFTGPKNNSYGASYKSTIRYRSPSALLIKLLLLSKLGLGNRSQNLFSKTSKRG